MIYALIDPKTDKIVYVGRTTQGWARPRSLLRSQHVRSNQGLNAWVQSLKPLPKNFARIHIIPIQFVEKQELADQETFWIQHYQSRGEAFLNINQGLIAHKHLKLKNIIKYVPNL